MQNDSENYFTRSEILDLDNILNNTDDSSSTDQLLDKDITRILKLANDSFDELTGNQNPNKHIGYYYNSIKDKYNFANRNTQCSVNLKIRSNLNQQDQPFIATHTFAEIANVDRMRRVDLRTWKAGKNVLQDSDEATLQSCCIANAISKVLNKKLILYGSCEQARKAALIAMALPNSINKSYLFAPLVPKDGQIKQSQRLREFFNQNTMTPQNVEDKLHLTTLCIKPQERDKKITGMHVLGFGHARSLGKIIRISTANEPNAHQGVWNATKQYIQTKVNIQKDSNSKKSSPIIVKSFIEQQLNRNLAHPITTAQQVFNTENDTFFVQRGKGRNKKIAENTRF